MITINCTADGQDTVLEEHATLQDAINSVLSVYALEEPNAYFWLRDVAGVTVATIAFCGAMATVKTYGDTTDVTQYDVTWDGETYQATMIK